MTCRIPGCEVRRYEAFFFKSKQRQDSKIALFIHSTNKAPTRMLKLKDVEVEELKFTYICLLNYTCNVYSTVMTIINYRYVYRYQMDM